MTYPEFGSNPKRSYPIYAKPKFSFLGLWVRGFLWLKSEISKGILWLQGESKQNTLYLKSEVNKGDLNLKSAIQLLQ